MQEALRIKNCGPINEEITVELNKATIIIGPQASGKSIIAKLITICRNIESLKNFQDVLVHYNIDTFFTSETEFTYEGSIMSLSYSNNNLLVTKKNLIDDIVSLSSEDYETSRTIYFDKLELAQQKIANADKNLQDAKSDDDDDPIIKEIENELEEVKRLIIEMQESSYRKVKDFEDNYIDDSFYIPAERSFFASFYSNVFALVKADIQIPKILVEFGTLLQNLQNNTSDIIVDFLDVSYSISNGKVSVVKNDTSIPLEVASSGLQSLYPILLIINAISNGYFKEKNFVQSFCIEEPELNLFPNTQNLLIKSLFKVLKSYSKLKLIITTHSPYVLTTINNLLLKGQIEKKISSDDTDINLSDALKSSDIAAYYLNNSKLENLIDKDTGLINAKKLDAASYDINTEYSTLMKIYRKVYA